MQLLGFLQYLQSKFYIKIFFSKNNLEIIYHLWDKLILFNDSYLVHFICIVFLIENKNKFKKVEEAQVPSIISQLILKNKEDVDNLIQKAIDLYLTTPKSLFLFGNKLEIFKYNSKRIKELFENYSPNLFSCLPIFPSEILALIYKNIKCINDECPCYIIKYQNIKNPECEFCNLKFNNLSNFLIVDLRIINTIEKRGINNFINMNETEINPGYLIEFFIPDLTKINFYNDNEKNEECFNYIYNQILLKIGEKNINDTHIIFLTTETNFYKETAYRKYKQIINENEIKYLYTHINGDIFYQHKNDLNENEYNNIIFENNLLINLINFLQSKYIKNISFVYGGYRGIHDILIKYKIPIISHGNKCLLCKRLKNQENKDEDDIKNVDLDKKNNAFISFFKKKISTKLNEIKRNLNIEDKKNCINSNLPKIFLKDNMNEIENNENIYNENIYKCHMKDNNKIFDCILIIHSSGIYVYKESEDNNSNKIFSLLVIIEYNDLQFLITNNKFKDSLLIYFKDDNKINHLFIIDFPKFELIKDFIDKIQMYLEKLKK